MGLASSAYEVTLTKESTPITANAKILTDDIIITKDFLGGGSGLLRLWFSFNTASDYQLTITKLGAANLTGFPLKVIATADFTLLSNGYYRFDIGVTLGDLINFSSSVQIDTINDLQVQRVQIAT